MYVGLLHVGLAKTRIAYRRFRLLLMQINVYR